MLAKIISHSLTSGRMRYAPTVGGEKLTRNDASHHRIPQQTNSKYVGAYRIRPDVSDQEMIAASKLSLKPCRAARQGYHARKSVAAKRSKVFLLGKMLPRSAARFSCSGKCSRGARQGFPAWENVAAERGKVFPPGKTFPGNRARFSHPGKCPSETEQGFPARGNVPRKPSKVFLLGKMFPTSAARFSH